MLTKEQILEIFNNYIKDEDLMIEKIQLKFPLTNEENWALNDARYYLEKMRDFQKLK